MAAIVVAVSGCGGSEADYANDPRPPSPINVSAVVSPDKVTVDPASFGAGPVTIVIANLTDDSQRLTVETPELSQKAGIRQQSSVINPDGTATLKLDVDEGDYMVSVESKDIRAAKVKVGAERKSSQDQLLQP